MRWVFLTYNHQTGMIPYSFWIVSDVPCNRFFSSNTRDQRLNVTLRTTEQLKYLILVKGAGRPRTRTRVQCSNCSTTRPFQTRTQYKDYTYSVCFNNNNKQQQSVVTSRWKSTEVISLHLVISSSNFLFCISAFSWPNFSRTWWKILTH